MGMDLTLYLKKRRKGKAEEIMYCGINYGSVNFCWSPFDSDFPSLADKFYYPEELNFIIKILNNERHIEGVKRLQTRFQELFDEFGLDEEGWHRGLVYVRCGC